MSQSSTDEHRVGAAYALAAFLFWGFAALFFKLLATASAFEILAHRVWWSCVLLALLLRGMGKLRVALALFRDRQAMVTLLATALLVGSNWLVFIYSIVANRVLESSLGYFINPLVNVLLGMMFLGERLNPRQWFAVAAATAGVAYVTWQTGNLSWISLTLAGTFGLYGLLRKQTKVPAVEGLFVETVLLGPIALGAIFWFELNGQAAFLHQGRLIDLTFVLTGLVTTLPLLWFTAAARRLNLSTVGFFQYIAPSCMFLLGVFVFHEPFSRVQLVTFSLIWLGLVVFSLDSLYRMKKAGLKPAVTAAK
ncbi:EamA family transporter RarD [Acanthopleuribacter pedis]|uniref:EamA family transporter RarD n=1 Tax=Acanthopleuribacter pedis TaxID=442870 RepID=A0A8J7QJ44_9BACT|nr:EamA family transporter RarD [Acanthopleuribacter pedis]MBO1319165.1 EamA family transporter RarD [Acanthopleuribacter pedis]